MTSRGPLDGLRVLDLSSQLSGPYCAMLLGDLGADVVKVERPGEGDDGRKMGPLLAGESAPFMTFNRNKRSITVDLKVPAGLAVVHRLAAGADVALENWRPGTAARLGIGYEDLRRINPRIVYCSISGFGQTGPYAGRGGFDRIAQGMSGLMSINDQVFADPQVRHREMAVEVDHPRAGRTRVLGIPIKLSGTPAGIRRPAPLLGQHTDEILAELGYDDAAVRDLHDGKVV